MKNYKPFIIVAILGIILISMLKNTSEEIKINHGEIKKGQLVIKELNDNEAIALDGKWEFYWNQLIDPGNFVGSREETNDYFDVPKLWKGNTDRGVEIDSNGQATYRMIFYLAPGKWEKEGLTIKMPYAYSAYKIWLNGDVIATNGNVGLNSKEESVIRRPQVVVIYPVVGENEIILQISNHHFYRGGLTKSILLGNASLFEIREKQIALDIFMAGSFLILGILFFLLYLKRKEEKAILYFSLICVVFLSRALLSNEIYISNIINPFNWEIGNRVEAGFTYVGIPIIFLLLSELYKSYFILRFIKVWKVFLIIGIGITTLSPHWIYDNALIYLNIAQLIYAVYLFVVFIRYFDKSFQDFYVLLVGKGALALYAIHDIFITYSLIDATLKLQIGTYIFVFSLGYALVLYLNREFCKVESLVVQNENMLTEISKMNQELEQLVEKRTSELEDSNRQLYELSMLDGLTRIPNRLQFDNQLNSFFEKAVKNALSISILFLDLDFFKDYNDNYGHIKGDEALREISGILNQAIKSDKNAFIARYGGEEFVALYLNKDINDTYALAESLRLLVTEMKISHEYSPISDRITISIGGISIIPTIEDTATNLLNMADKALYRAKEQGRNRTYMWHS